MYHLNKRQIEIITFLLNKDEYITAKSISKEFNVSIRTIRYDIELAENWLALNDTELKKLPNQGMAIKTNLNKEVLLERLKFVSVENRVLSEKERISYVTLELLSNNHELTITEMSNKLFLSKNTIMKVIADARQFLKNNNLELERVHSKGYRVKGDEVIKREVLVKLFLELFDSNSIILALYDHKVYTELIEFCKNDYPNFNFKDIINIFDIIKSIEAECNYCLTDEALAKLILYLTITIYRIEQNNNITISDKRLRSYEEYIIGEKIAFQLSQAYDIVFIDEEIDEIVKQIIESNLFYNISCEGSLQSFDDEVIHITKSIIQYAENEFKVSMTNDQLLFQALALHLKSALFRIKNKREIDNSYTNEIINKFPLVYQIVKEGLDKFGNGYVFEENEIAYITLHIRAGYERNYNENYMSTALIIAQEGVAILELIATKLQRIIPELKIIKTCSMSDYHNHKKEIDLVITTNNFKGKDVEVIKVSPFLDNEDIYHIRNTLIKLNKFKQVYRYNQIEKIKGGRTVLLEDLLTIDMIKLGVEAKDWEDAIRQSSLPLLKHSKIKKAYVDNMIQAVHELGPYIVIMPGIAFAHARPDETVLKTCMSMITLKTPIHFGSEQNDPVNIVFTFGAENGNDHLKALQDLAKFLSLEENVEYLKKATDRQELLEKLINF